MKTLESSLRGRGRGAMRGRGRGRGRGDVRFASRFTDPRFQLARRGRTVRRGGVHHHHDAAQQDPRFAKHLRKMEMVSEESDSDDKGEEIGAEDELQYSVSDGTDGPSDGDEMALSDGEAEVLDDDVAAWSASDVEFVEPHRRLAIVNCSWDHVRAVDLYAILFYALPLGGQLVDVAVYMSEFGKRMLEHERVHGPDLWVTADGERSPQSIATEPHGKNERGKGGNKTKSHGSSDGDSDAGKEGDDVVGAYNGNENSDLDYDDDDPWVDDNVAMLHEEGEDGELFSQGKHRKYERNRMKYYYAIATFDSPETAESVYKQMDGMDIEASGVVLDLRYVGDDEVFENPVNRADCVPPNYKPLAAFKAAALSQTRFRISWDQDDVIRHNSIRDSFTGDTVDDDLAAYIAPPDSSDEVDDEGDENNNNNNNNGNSKKIKRGLDKLHIRKKYASLLEEIGGLPDECQRSEDGNEVERSSSSSGGDDDDSLNRFSDVEVEEAGEQEDEDGEASGFVGEIEATLDLDAGTKAARLQREAHLKQIIKSGDLGSRAELKYKLRRKELRKAKKEMLLQEREAETAKLQSEREKRREALRAAIGTDDAGATHMSGKEKRKLHAKAVKQRMAAERDAKKKMRASNTLGVTREVREAQRREAADSAVDAIDPRFQNKLLTDPRFHLDVAYKDKRSNADIVGLAATVATARQAKRPKAREKTGADGAMEYFLNRPPKRAKKE